MRLHRLTALAAHVVLVAAPIVLVAPRAHAGNVLGIVDTKVDPPTLIDLGVQVLISGDDNHDATIGLRYRKTGAPDWKPGLPLLRVHPERVLGLTVPEQFAGSALELDPDSTYELELKAHDPDGFDKTWTVSAKTRAVPKDPPSPHAVSVTDVGSLNAALGAAKAGDVITLKNGTYSGNFSINASGAAGNPIVLRGESEDGVIIEGGGCTPCNVFEIYGSFVHLESMTIQNAERAVRWQNPGAEANVLRRVHAKNVRLGVGGKQDQKDFVICDNVFEGKISWPLTYGDDGAAHASDDGLVVQGSGMVVCHNVISGFADALQNFQEGTRGNDFYGNDVLWTYDDGIELDGTAGNSRCFRNRFTNTFDALSFQPIFGGPAYVFRNVIVNVAGEGMKLHAEGSSAGPKEPVGIDVFHNTFVKGEHAIQLSTPNVVHDYTLENNLFVTQSAPLDGTVVNWDTPIDFTSGLLDYDGYFPDGRFHWGYGSTGIDYASFAAMVAGGRYEPHATLLGAAIFASGLTAPTDRKPKMGPQDVTLAAGSGAIDKGTNLANVSDGYRGSAPDLGALELGCPLPIFGVRPVGTDESNEPRGCASTVGPGGDAGPGDGGPTTDGGGPGKDGGGPSGDAASGGDGGTSGPDGGGPSAGDAPSDASSGCGCDLPGSARARDGWTIALALAAFAVWRRRDPRTVRARG